VANEQNRELTQEAFCIHAAVQLCAPTDVDRPFKSWYFRGCKRKRLLLTSDHQEDSSVSIKEVGSPQRPLLGFVANLPIISIFHCFSCGYPYEESWL